MPHPGTSSDMDLHVLRTESDPAVCVALVRLSPIYVHGLRIALTVAGLANVVVVEDVQDLHDVAGPGVSLVAVLASGDGPALSTLQEQGKVDVQAVHVLSEATVQAYSRALRSGATGAFEHSAELEHVVRTVRSAAVGNTLLPNWVARALVRPEAGPPPHLERQERTYLRGLADGATVSQLARRVGYSEREMYRLLSGTYRKLGAHNRTEALLLAERWGLLAEETQ